MSNRSNRSVPVLLTTAASLGLLLLPATPARADDSASLQQPTCTIVGTAGDDVLRGSAGDDVICGLAGDDVIVGEAGDDVLLGGPGEDLLVGGPGLDQLYGDDGDDRLVDTRAPTNANGGPGADLCVAVAGSVVTDCERVYVL